MADFPWRPLGELLVDRGLIDEYQLEYALKEQRLSGMLFGELLVARGLVSADELAAAVASQHGLALGTAETTTAQSQQEGSPGVPARRNWRPLGRLLVEKGLLTESGLQRVLVEQRRHGGMVGEILVRRGYVSPGDLAAALAEQHGLAVDAEVLDSAVPAKPVAPEHPDAYEVRTPDASAPLHVSGSFLDASDLAFEVLEADDPEALEIVRVRGPEQEVVWSYSREAADAARAADPAA